MSTGNALETLTGKQQTATTDWEKRYHELEQQMNGLRVEQGRVKKLDEELKARDKRISELEEATRKSAISASVSDEDRASVPDEVLNFTEKLVGATMKREHEENERRFRELEQRNEAERTANAESARQSFVAKINAKYPKFISSVTNGGDKVSEWEAYQTFNAATIDEAIRTNDFNTLSYHIEHFYTDHLGIQVPSGGESGSAAPDPRSHGGGNGTSDAPQGKVYTQSEYMALYDQVEAARSRGDYAEMKRLSAEIKNALAENRVKGE